MSTDRHDHFGQSFLALAESVSDGFVTIDSDGRIVYANRAAHELLGVAEGGLLSRPITAIMPEEYRGLHERGMERYLATGEKRLDWKGTAFPILRSDGATFDGEVSYGEYAIHGERFFTGIIRDISERRSLEAQLRQAQKLEGIGRLAGGVAHDFNNLLAVIQGHAEMALGEASEDSDIAEDLNGVLAAVERASAMTGQLLRFSRADTLDLRTLDLSQVVSELDPMLRRLLPERIELQFQCPEGELWLEGDANELHRVVLNLVQNAADAIEGAGRITLTVDGADADEEPENTNGQGAGDHVRLRITDTGGGISADVRERMFEPFFTTKPKGKGTGLGLSTVLGIVAQAGGSISVRSRLGLGTTFELLFPRVAGSEPEPAGLTVEHSSPAQAGKGERTILVVEDDAALANVTARALQRSGHRVLVADDGAEALRIGDESKERIDLLLIDVGLPGAPGPEVARQVHELLGAVRIVFMSGHSSEEIGAIPPGAAAFLRKPFSIAQLLSTVDAAFRE